MGGAYVVVLPGVEVNVADVGLDFAGLRFYGHESGVHVAQHEAQRVDR